MIVNPIVEDIERSNKTKHEEKLINEGKVKDSNEVINEIAEILKNNDENRLNKYLSEDFLYYYSNKESKYLSSFFRDLKILSSSYDIEERGNSMNEQKTYRIYWNIVKGNEHLGRTDQYYCLQKITIILKKAVKEDIITYEIEKISLTDN